LLKGKATSWPVRWLLMHSLSTTSKGQIL